MTFIPKHWTLERVFLVGTFFVSAAAFVFGVGVNWARVTATDARVEAFERTYVRADVYLSEQKRVGDALERLNRNMEKFESYWYQEPERQREVRPTPRGRSTPRQQFDR